MKQHLKSMLSPLALIALWEWAVQTGIINGDFLPAPTQVARAMAQIGPQVLLSELSASLVRVAAGLALAGVVGVVIGTWMAINQHVDNFLAPLLAAAYAIPKSAFIPLLILWAGVGNASTIAVIFIACLIPVVVYTFHGVREVPRVLRWGATTLGGSRANHLVSVLLPAASVQILTGLRIALGFGFTLAVSSEMIASTSGIGKLIFVYGQGGTYDMMFAALSVLVLAAFLADQLFTAFCDHYLRWMPTERANEAAA